MPDPEERPTLAENLDRLFDSVRPMGPLGPPYTNEEVATAVKQADPSIRVGGAYLSALRKGTKKNPSTELLTALARFFGVPSSYLLDKTVPASADAEIELARVAHNLEVRKLALRALELSPEGLATVSRLVEEVLEGGAVSGVEGGGPVPGGTPPEATASPVGEA
ncbi:XRE family transcriptional regulator [Streptomyces sp. NPDC005438]|uniref:XRE family transcriptional regulator n=1 Tax=Streptomyces sp. NPDC005438 TaxID=3156880 RepID=UPI00339F94B9